MDPEDDRGAAAALLRRLGDGANAAEVSRAVVGTWTAINAELGPVIGPRGVAALYHYSLQRVAPAHPWLADALAEDRTLMDLVALKRVLAMQSRADAARGGHAGLQTFHDLLAALVGATLTERLLRPVWTDSPGMPPAQGASP
jgi:hypothetical protein